MHKGLVIRQVFMLGDLALGLLVAFVAYLIVIGLFDSGSTHATNGENPIDAAPNEMVVAKVAPRQAYDALISNGLFGDAGRARTDAPPAPEVLPIEVTKRRLALLGTTVAEDRWASATIKDETRGETDVYCLNETVVDQVILLEVHRREVILFDQAKNTREILRMDAEDGASRSSLMSPQGRMPLARRSVASRDVIEVNKAKFVEEITENYADIAQKLQPKPYKDDSGRVVGFTSDNVSQLGLAKELGLQDGDVVQTVNGITVDSEEKIFELAQKFRNARIIRLGILRRGKPQVITYNLKE